jgi:hypothetical protein
MDKQCLNYQRLAYTVLRDAAGFYLGIPEFFIQNADKDVAIKSITDTGKTEEEAQKIIAKRIKELEDDFKDCFTLLTSDNIWYQLLGLNPENFYNYLQNLSAEDKADLAVVPKWTTQDYSLGRPYISDKLILNGGTNRFTEGL